MLLEREKMKSGVAAVFDIAGNSIGAALVSPGEKGKPPQVLYATRAPFPFLKEPDPVRLTQAMLSTFVVVALRLQREGLPRIPRLISIGSGHVQQAVCFFSSPWHSSTVSKVVMQKNEPFMVPKNIGEMLFDSEDPSPHVDFFALQKDAPESKKKAKAASAPKKSAGAVAIEQHIVSMKLNGYPTNSPEGKKAKKVEATTIGSVVPEDVYEKLHAVVDRVLHGGELYAHSFTMPLGSVARGVFGEKGEYLLINVGGEVCDITIIENDAPVLFISMPFGTEPLIRALADRAHIVPEEVNTRLGILQKSTSESADKKSSAIVRALAEIEQEWKELVRAALRSAPLSSPLPRRAFIWGQGPHTAWFAHMFSSIALPEATFSTETFTVEHIDKSGIAALANFKNGEEYDEALAAEAAFIHQ